MKLKYTEGLTLRAGSGVIAEFQSQINHFLALLI